MGAQVMARVERSVAPAKAGASCGKRALRNCETPAFAGVTMWAWAGMTRVA